MCFFLQYLTVLFLLLEAYKCEDDLVKTIIYKPVQQKPRYERVRPTIPGNGNKAVEHRIIRGSPCSTRTYPFMVGLLVQDVVNRNKLRLDCGGSLIRRKLVLTAGHCAGDQLWAGVLMETEDEYIEQVVAFYTHPKFILDTLDNDVAVLVLLKPIRDKPIALVKLPKDSSSYKTDMSSICRRESLAMGWGKTETGAASSTFLCVKLPVITTKQCRRLYGADVVPIHEVFCTLSSDGRDSCQGDSGGPLLCGQIQMGIVSWGNNVCGDPRGPGVYSRTDYYLEFIQKVIKKESKRSIGQKVQRKPDHSTANFINSPSIILKITVFLVVCFL